MNPNMKSLILPAFDPSRTASEQFAENFKACGINADWSVQAYHLSDSRVTGHQPNKTSGDFYLIEADDLSEGWNVVIRTYNADRTDAERDGNDLIEIVAEFKNAGEAWEWLKDPVSQQFYLLGNPDELAQARGLSFRGEDVPTIRKGDVIRVLPQFQDEGESEIVWQATEDESAGRVSISKISHDPRTIQTLERRMVQPVTLTADMLHGLTVTSGNIKSLVDSGTLSSHTCENWLRVVDSAIKSVNLPA